MTKSELIQHLAERNPHLYQRDVERIVSTIFDEIATALSRGDRVGVIALGPRSIVRHLRYLRQLGLIGRLAGERPLNLSVADSERPEAVERLLEVGAALRDTDGADVLVLGCAGMARHRRALEGALSLPVIDPTQAATADALGAVLLA